MSASKPHGVNLCGTMEGFAAEKLVSRNNSEDDGLALVKRQEITKDFELI
jgi:hypothetical protein